MNAVSLALVTQNLAAPPSVPFGITDINFDRMVFDVNRYANPETLTVIEVVPFNTVAIPDALSK